MSIVLENPELEAAVTRMAADRGMKVEQLAAQVLATYVDSLRESPDERKQPGGRSSVARVLEIARKSSEAATLDGSFTQDDLYDEYGLPNGPSR